MKSVVFEIVTFKLKPGTEEAGFLATLAPTEAFLRACPGFRSRRLSRGDSGEWLDLVEWADLESAQAAARNFGSAEGVGPFMACIDGPTIDMRHHILKAAH